MIPDEPSAFERATAGAAKQTIVSDFWYFLRDNRKWWMLPLIAALLVFGALLMLSGTGAAPFLYTLF